MLEVTDEKTKQARKDREWEKNVKQWMNDLKQRNLIEENERLSLATITPKKEKQKDKLCEDYESQSLT
jgi:hypothetical protein